MAQPKTWTATDIELGSLNIRREGSSIRFEQRYQFEDAGGEVLSEIATGRFVDVKALVDIPTSILDALTTINNWLYQQCLEQEGMQNAS